jgi:hypothetical protein
MGIEGIVDLPERAGSRAAGKPLATTLRTTDGRL